MSDNVSILLVEDELNFGSVLSQFLTLHGFNVTWAKNGAEAWSVIKSDRSFDCCVLDVMMPEMDGFTLGEEIKRSSPEIPFVFLTARSLKEDIIRGFKAGAHDYITKPFDSEILVYKIRALMERRAAPPKPIAQATIGGFEFDPELQTLRFGQDERHLSPKETKLLGALATHLNEVVSREDLVTAAWEEDSYFTRRSMDVYISKLRKYLQQDPGVVLTSVHGGGYKLEVISAAES